MAFYTEVSVKASNDWISKFMETLLLVATFFKYYIAVLAPAIQYCRAR
jgi:hypothetical protein